MGKYKLLIIDDDISSTELISAMLADNTYEIHVATDGDSGINLAKVVIPDIIILDVLTPDKNSLEICREIRKFTIAPILILSNISKPEMVAHALDEGADDYLIKPVSASLLNARIITLTRRAQAEKTAAITDNYSHSHAWQ